MKNEYQVMVTEFDSNKLQNNLNSRSGQLTFLNRVKNISTQDLNKIKDNDKIKNNKFHKLFKPE